MPRKCSHYGHAPSLAITISTLAGMLATSLSLPCLNNVCTLAVIRASLPA